MKRRGGTRRVGCARPWVALALLCACDVVDPSLLADREDGVRRSEPDAAVTGDAAAPCPPDADPTALELCNGIDDDCDGAVDERASDQCALDHAVAACMPGGGCLIVECEDDFLDCNGRADDGCETAQALAPCGCMQACGDAGAGVDAASPDVTPTDPTDPSSADATDPDGSPGGADASACEPVTEICNGEDDDCDGDVDEDGVCELQACIEGGHTLRGPDCDACACANCRTELDQCQLSDDADAAMRCQALVACFVENPCVDCYGSGDCVEEVHLATGVDDPTDSTYAAERCAVDAPYPCGYGAAYRACLDASCPTECPQ